MNELSKQMQRDIVLVNELLSTNTEMGCVEFKHNNESPSGKQILQTVFECFLIEAPD